MNKMGKVLLTIAIPTFNSPSTLLQTLQSIENQKTHDFGSELEILISDNASTYNVEEFLQSNLSSNFFSKLKININNTNLGYDKNLLKIMSISTGTYVKLLADDDILSENFLIKYRQLLLSDSPDIVVNNFEFLDKKMMMILKSSWFDLYKLPILNDQLLNLDLCCEAYGQVSSLTFKRELVLGLEIPTKKTNYIHVYWFFSLIEEHLIKFESEVLVSVRQGSPNFTGDGVINILTPLGGIEAILGANLKNKALQQKLISVQERYCLNQLSSLNFQPFTVRALLFYKFVPFFKKLPQFWLFWTPFILMPNLLRSNLKKIRKFLRKSVVRYNSVYE